MTFCFCRRMRCLLLGLSLLGAAASAEASWYWPFGSDDDKDAEEPRMSDLMERATELIDLASDLAAEGKTGDAVATNRAVLAELDRIERENPGRAKKPEFSTLKTKRAYVEAAIDALLLREAQLNARAVATSDTTALEARLRAEREGTKGSAKVEKSVEAKKTETDAKEPVAAKRQVKTVPKRVKRKNPEKPLSPREQVMKDIATGNHAAAERTIAAMLKDHPNEAAALNLKAAVEAAQGKFKEAERSLDRAIQSHPRDYHAYCNMAALMLQTGNRDGARRYYETARSFGAPQDAQLEEALR